MFVMMIAWLFIAVASACSSLANVFLKIARTGVEDLNFIQQITSLHLLLGCFFYVLSFAFFAKSLEILPVSIGYPVLAGLGFFCLTLLASFFLGERITLGQYLGMLFILIGIFLTSRNGEML